MSRNINLGIIGLDTIENSLIPPVKNVQGIKLYGIVTCNKSEAEIFAKEHGLTCVYDSYEEIVQDNNIDAIYIGTYNTMHREDILLCLNHGKHVIVEKPITISFEDYKYLKSVADEKGLIFTEAIMLCYMPITNIILDIVKSKKLGELKYILAPFGTRKPRNPNNRFFNYDLGGGSLFDVGVYALTLCAMCLDNHAEYELFATGMLAETGVDDQSVITIKNSKGQMAVMPLTFSARMAKEATLAFEDAYIVIDTYPCSTKATIFYNNGQVETLIDGEMNHALAYEMEAFANDFAKGEYELTKQFQELHYKVQKWMDEARNLIIE